MQEKIAQVTEHAAYSATGVIVSGTYLQWFNANAQAVVAMCAIGSFIIGAIAAAYRMRLAKIRHARRKND